MYKDNLNSDESIFYSKIKYVIKHGRLCRGVRGGEWHA